MQTKGPSTPDPLLDALRDVAMATASGVDATSLAMLVVRRTRALLGADSAHVYLLDDAASLLRSVASDPPETAFEGSVDVRQGIAGQALERREAMVVPDYPGWQHATRVSISRGVRAAAAAPM